MKKEYKYAVLISLVVLVLVNLPLLYFSFFPKTGLVFLGRRVINSQDLYTYLSYIEQSKEGNFLLSNMYTTESQVPTLVRPSYVLIGKFAHIANLTPIVSYHIARIFFSLIFCFVLYAFIKKFFDKPTERLLTFLIVLLSSGWGVFLSQLVNSSDLWIPESNTFLSLAESPHFILTQTLILLGILMYVSYIQKNQLKYMLGMIVCLFPIAFEHPFDLLVIVPVLFITEWWRRKTFPSRKITILFGLCTVGLLYPIIQNKLNPLFAQEQLQGASISPVPLNYLVGFGFLVPLAIWGAEKVFNSKNIFWKIAIVWAMVGAVSLYAPVTFQRRMSEGIHIPLALLSSYGLFSLYPLVYKKMKQVTKPLTIFFFLILFASSFRALYIDFTTISKDSLSTYFYYITKGERDGFQWLSENSDEDDTILSNWFYGNLIPGMMTRKVFIGHTAQTISFNDKVNQINTFLVNPDPLSNITFLHQNNIKYIFLGENDSMLQYGFKPGDKEFLTKVYDESGVLIYKVN